MLDDCAAVQMLPGIFDDAPKLGDFKSRLQVTGTLEELGRTWKNLEELGSGSSMFDNTGLRSHSPSRFGPASEPDAKLWLSFSRDIETSSDKTRRCSC